MLGLDPSSPNLTSPPRVVSPAATSRGIPHIGGHLAMTTSHHRTLSCCQPHRPNSRQYPFDGSSRTQSSRRSLLVSRPARVDQYAAVPLQYVAVPRRYQTGTCCDERCTSLDDRIQPLHAPAHTSSAHVPSAHVSPAHVSPAHVSPAHRAANARPSPDVAAKVDVFLEIRKSARNPRHSPLPFVVVLL